MARSCVIAVAFIGWLISNLPSAIGRELLSANHLTRENAHGQIALRSSYRHSDEFFDEKGSLREANAQFQDYQFLMHSDYGLTDRLTLTIDIPLIYRIEDDLLHADDFGLGDTALGFIYGFWRPSTPVIEAAFSFHVKMPSGDSDVQLLNLDGSNDREIPLGTGQFDLRFGCQFLGKLSFTRWQFDFTYVHRLGDRVNYLQAEQNGIDPDTGDPFTRLVGNLEVNYGDEFWYQLSLDWRPVVAFQIGSHLSLRHFLSGEIEKFAIDESTSVESKTRLSAGYELAVTPYLNWQLLRSTGLQMAARVPIAGEDVPVLSLTESLVGITYSLAVWYDF